MIVPPNKVAKTHLQRMKHAQTVTLVGPCHPCASVCMPSSRLFYEKQHAESEDTASPNRRYSWPGRIRRLPVLFCALHIFLTVGLTPFTENTLVEYAFASNGGGMSCVAENCAGKLSKCLSDGNCSRGMGCFVKCAAMDYIVSSSKNAQGLCQARCMDLHESSVFNDFAHCAMTQNKCIDPIPADLRYPPLPTDIADQRLLKDVASTANELKKLFRGRWYNSAGLNRAYDTFDCQMHRFYPTSNPTSEFVIADATFAYRVPLDNGHFFTKKGLKRLELVSKDESSGIAFPSEKKWGVDVFPINDSGLDVQSSEQYQLQLTLRPDVLNYKDNWSILSYSNDKRNGYIVVAYRGTNSATEGYGGLNVYTRSPISLNTLFSGDKQSTSGEQQMMDGIQSALDKVNLSWKDLIQVDNSCNSENKQSPFNGFDRVVAEFSVSNTFFNLRDIISSAGLHPSCTSKWL